MEFSRIHINTPVSQSWVTACDKDSLVLIPIPTFSWIPGFFEKLVLKSILSQEALLKPVPVTDDKKDGTERKEHRKEGCCPLHHIFSHYITDPLYRVERLLLILVSHVSASELNISEDIVKCQMCQKSWRVSHQTTVASLMWTACFSQNLVTWAWAILSLNSQSSHSEKMLHVPKMWKYLPGINRTNLAAKCHMRSKVEMLCFLNVWCSLNTDINTQLKFIQTKCTFD